MATRKEREREKHHSKLRTAETELRNTLTGINDLVRGVDNSIRVKDCKTARLNFDQAQIAFRAIGRNLVRVETLYRKLRLPPGSLIEEHQGHPAPPKREAAPPPKPTTKATTKPTTKKRAAKRAA